MICLLSESKAFLNLEKLRPLEINFGCDESNFEAEVKLIPKIIECFQKENDVTIDDIFKFVNFLEQYKIAFHEVHKLTTIRFKCGL